MFRPSPVPMAWPIPSPAHSTRGARAYSLVGVDGAVRASMSRQSAHAMAIQSRPNQSAPTEARCTRFFPPRRTVRAVDLPRHRSQTTRTAQRDDQRRPRRETDHAIADSTSDNRDGGSGGSLPCAGGCHASAYLARLQHWLSAADDHARAETHRGARGAKRSRPTDHRKWSIVDGGNNINDAMLAGVLDIAGIGIPGFWYCAIALWVALRKWSGSARSTPDRSG